MSILIKGMKMPKNEPLLVKINPDGSVSTTAKNGYKKYEAVSVPPHGDLIDAQEQMRLMQSCEYDTYNDYSRAFDMLDNAPTVIEAEEGET